MKWEDIKAKGKKELADIVIEEAKLCISYSDDLDEAIRRYTSSLATPSETAIARIDLHDEVNPRETKPFYLGKYHRAILLHNGASLEEIPDIAGELEHQLYVRTRFERFIVDAGRFIKKAREKAGLTTRGICHGMAYTVAIATVTIGPTLYYLGIIQINKEKLNRAAQQQETAITPTQPAMTRTINFDGYELPLIEVEGQEYALGYLEPGNTLYSISQTVGVPFDKLKVMDKGKLKTPTQEESEKLKPQDVYISLKVDRK